MLWLHVDWWKFYIHLRSLNSAIFEWLKLLDYQELPAEFHKDVHIG
jgi:hypothetical protein